MSDHIPDAGKMVSDTPRTDAAIWNSKDRSWMDGTLCKQLERELNAANSIIRQQQLLDEENLGLRQRIKRLEEAGDQLFELCDAAEHQFHLADEIPQRLEAWTAAKEAKP